MSLLKRVNFLAVKLNVVQVVKRKLSMNKFLLMAVLLLLFLKSVSLKFYILFGQKGKRAILVQLGCVWVSWRGNVQLR